MFEDNNDYPVSMSRKVLRSVLFRSGLAARLGPAYWRPTCTAPYIRVPYRHSVEMFAGIPTAFADLVYGSMIGPDSARWSRFYETVTAIDDCWVEPNRCQIIGSDGRVVRQSMTHRLVPMYPSAVGYAMRGRGSPLDEAVVYDGRQSTNYYHHLIDSLPGIFLLLERSGLAQDLPLVVNRWIFESRFFAYLRQRSPKFAALNWRVQEPGEWIYVKRAYRLHAAPFDRAALAWARDLYGQLSPPRGRRIFLSRDPAMFGRGIHNETEVAALLAAHGFEAVYAEHLTVEEQQRTFEECEYLVALQGMGLVQQIFMDPARGHVLELMPANRLQSEFYWLGWARGMKYYDVQTGSGMDASGKYHVDLERLEAGVRRMLHHPANRRRYGETFVD